MMNRWQEKLQKEGYSEFDWVECENDYEYFLALHRKPMIKGGSTPHSRGLGNGRYTTQWTHGIEGNSGSREDWGK